MECRMCGEVAEPGQIFYYVEIAGDAKELCQTCKLRLWKVMDAAVEGWPDKVMVPQTQKMLEPLEVFGASKADAGG